MSEVSKRNAMTASAPLACASSTIRCMTSSRLATRFLVIPLSSPPTRDLRPAPSCEPTFLARTVSPNTSPSTSVTRYPGTSFIVLTSTAPPFTSAPTAAAEHYRRMGCADPRATHGKAARRRKGVRGSDEPPSGLVDTVRDGPGRPRRRPHCPGRAVGRRCAPGRGPHARGDVPRDRERRRHPLGAFRARARARRGTRLLHELPQRKGEGPRGESTRRGGVPLVRPNAPPGEGQRAGHQGRGRRVRPVLDDAARRLPQECRRVTAERGDRQPDRARRRGRGARGHRPGTSRTLGGLPHHADLGRVLAGAAQPTPRPAPLYPNGRGLARRAPRTLNERRATLGPGG